MEPSAANAQQPSEMRYEVEQPRHILSVVWPGGRVVHFATMRDHCWPAFMAGNYPVQEPGVTLEIWDEDGTAEWQDLYARVLQGPVHSQRVG
jgi:hypothetical protein